ncbi:MAG: type II secretion system F family protein [bacterium]|nr:type II secretion system F family protein [bacterium]
MKQFFYKIIDINQGIIKGSVLASGRESALRQVVKHKDIIVIYIKRNYLYLPLNRFTGKKINKKIKIKKEELITFTRQLQTLFTAGIPILDCVITARSLVKDKSLKPVLDDIVANIKTGMSLSQSLSLFPKVFGNDYISLIKVGEASGTLDKILEELYIMLEWEKELRKRFWNAVRYPMIVIGIGFLAMIGMFTLVIPKFVGMFGSSGAELPVVTKIIFSINTFLQISGLPLLIIFFMLFIVIIIAYKKTRFREFVDSLFLRIPILGEIFKKFMVARFCKVFAILYSNGLAILPALKISKNLYSHSTYQKDISYMIDQMERGVSMADATGNTLLFTGVVNQMAGIGQKSGALAVMFEKVNELYSEDIKYNLTNLFTYLEPLFIVIIAGLIMSLALGILMPMWNMVGQFSQGV